MHLRFLCLAHLLDRYTLQGVLFGRLRGEMPAMELSRLNQIGASRAFLELTNLFSAEMTGEISLVDLNVLFRIGSAAEGIDSDVLADELKLSNEKVNKSVRKLSKLDLNLGCDGVGVISKDKNYGYLRLRLTPKGERLIERLKDSLPDMESQRSKR